MKKTLARIIAGLATFVAGYGVAMAQSVWVGDGTGIDITSNGNPGWNGSGIPNAVDAVADYSLLTTRIQNITVSPTNGTMILNTAGAVTFGFDWANPALKPVVFDVSSGRALLDLGGTNTGRSVTFRNGWTLNDNLLSTWSNKSASFTLNVQGVITGAGGIETYSWSDVKQLYNLFFNLSGANTFSGGIVVGSNTILGLGHSMAAGTGDIVMTNNTAIQLHIGTMNITNNIRTANSSDYGTLIMSQASSAISLYGNITGTGRARLGGTGGSSGTFILKGTNTPQFEMMPASGSTMAVQVDNDYSMPAGGILMAGSAGRQTTLRFNAAGTYTQGIASMLGWDAANHVNFTMVVGTTDTLADKVTLNSATAMNFSVPTGGVSLVAGHAGGTLEVQTQLTDLGSNRNVLVTGPGTVIISRETGNAYGGTTTVSSGTLLVNGSLGGAGAVTVAAGATLGGAGVITGHTTVNGTLSPGTSPGTLTFEGNLTLGSGSTSEFEINGLLVGQYDQVLLSSLGTQNLTLGGTLDVTFGTFDAN
ncbi:MAG: hypothetical protein U1D97_10885, partial [Desulfuromonadales bacterium]|nr:hypothetical protein [Desulfuromonadales bacterium]